jgi:peroxiredoxin
MKVHCLTLVLCWFSLLTSAHATQYEFSLESVQGELVSVTPQEESALTAVVFLGTECPMARAYSSSLQTLADQFAADGVRVVGVMSNRQDSLNDIRGFLKETEVRFPVVRDLNNRIADAYGATRTPEAFLLSGDLELLYHGRIDNQYQPGVARGAATRHDLQAAIEQALAGKPIEQPETPFTGCLIGKVRLMPPTVTTTLTYSREISRILQRHCVECHRDGDIGPFAMDSYDEVVGWGETMVEVMDNGRMPPWHADPEVGHFANARHMPQSDIDAIREWVRGGMPEGDPSELPEPIEIATGWQLPSPPDAVYEMSRRPFQVPASGTVEYQYFVVDPQLEEDTWISDAQVIPGNRSVVHHAIVFIRPPDGEQFRGVGWLTAYVPGQRMVTAPPGHARRVPAGSKFVFQMHYTPTGSPQEDLTRVGIVKLDPESVTHEMFTVIGIDQEFEIPPLAEAHPVRGTVGWFPQTGKVLGYMPHMHFRGRSFELSAQLKSEQVVPLLNVPNYDFNWQHFYMLEEPIELQDVEALSFTATFDNSPDNPFNPNPQEWVTWGDQTWEEMAVVFLQVAQLREQSVESDGDADGAVRLADWEQAVDAFVQDFFARLDTNLDGVVRRAEAPLSIREFHFARYDSDGDGVITSDEVRSVAELRIQR